MKYLFLSFTLLTAVFAIAKENGPVGEQSNMNYSLQKQPQKYVIGIEIRTSNAEFQKTVPPLWQKFYQEIASQIPNKKSEAVLAVYSEYEEDYTKPFNYLIGYEVSSLDSIPEGLVGKVIPAAKYAVVTADGPFPHGLINTWTSIWKSPLKRGYTVDFELYPADFDPQNNPQVEIFIAL